MSLQLHVAFMQQFHVAIECTSGASKLGFLSWAYNSTKAFCSHNPEHYEPSKPLNPCTPGFAHVAKYVA